MAPKQPRFLEDFILPSLHDGRFGELLKWDETEDEIFCIRWRHKGASTWTEEDTIVFQGWDKLKGHHKPDAKHYLRDSKQRFRSSLYKLNTFAEMSSIEVDNKVFYKRYRIIKTDKPKRRKKQYTSGNTEQCVPFSPIREHFPESPESAISDQSLVSVEGLQDVTGQLFALPDSNQYELSVPLEQYLSNVEFLDISPCNVDFGLDNEDTPLVGSGSNAMISGCDSHDIRYESCTQQENEVNFNDNGLCPISLDQNQHPSTSFLEYVLSEDMSG